MKTFEDDSKLREILKDLKLDSPGKDFTMNVLDRIHREVPYTFQAIKEPMFGKGFWIFIILFALLGVTMFIVAGSATGSEGVIGKFLNSLDTSSADSAYKGILSRFNSVPAGIVGILTATSLLVFIERFLSARKSKI